MSSADLVLAVAPLRGAEPVRVRLVKQITTIGSDTAADLRLPTVSAHWAVVHRGDASVEVVITPGGQRHRIAVGELRELDGVTLGLESALAARDRERAIEELVSALAAVDSAERAIELLLTGIIAATGADVGALILSDRDGYSVAAARDSRGQPLSNPEELLSDTVVRDVLGTGERLQLDDVAAHSRYAGAPSIAALRLASVACLPMRLEGKTLGAVFVARRDRTSYDERTIAELRILAAVAVPFLAQLRRAQPPPSEELIGESQAIQRLRALVRRVGPSDLSALLHGPSGSGKELVARAIHAASPRATRPMIAVNCAAVAPTLLDAELFGYRKGAFTGAMTDRIGLVEAAHESTLFLDEIGDMSLAMQAALLRVLEQREVKRIGENVPRPVDFRLICATHRDLETEVAEGRFRADLLFRLREVTVEIPSLAQRGEDIALLAHAFLRQTEVQLGLTMHTLTDEALAALRAHPWPGNVRELKATIRRAAILADSKLIRAADLGFAPLRSVAQDPAPHTAAQSPPEAALRALVDALLAPGADLRPLANVRDELVREYVLLAIERSGDDREAAAKALEIVVRTLYRYIS